VRNIERDPRVTLQVEAGVEYHLLRGVMFRCEARLHRDTEVVAQLGGELFRRYGNVEVLDEGVQQMVDQQAPKRVALEFVEQARVSWDHRKLGGIY
jgi:hypothetical protein